MLSTAANAPSDSRSVTTSSMKMDPPYDQAKENDASERSNGLENFERKFAEQPLQQASSKKSIVLEHSLWALAYENLQAKNPELVERFEHCLGISTTRIDTDNRDIIGPSMEKVVQGAFQELEKCDYLKERLNSASSMRNGFEQVLKIINASKDYISSAVSVNPYAALAWTGVNLLLPVRSVPVLVLYN